MLYGTILSLMAAEYRAIGVARGWVAKAGNCLVD